MTNRKCWGPPIAVVLMVALPTIAFCDAKSDLEIVSKRHSGVDLLYLKNKGSRSIVGTILEEQYQNGKKIGELKKEHFVSPMREVYIGSPTPDSTGFRVRYTLIFASYKN